MKSVLIRLLHLFMAVLVLFSSMGFGLVEHSCQLRGKRMYSVHDTRPDCRLCAVHTAAPDPSPTLDRTDCCKDQTRYSKVDTTSSLSHQLTKFIKVVSDRFGAGTAALLLVLVAWSFIDQTYVAVAAYASPPPLSGRHLLVFVQSFLI